MHAAEWGEERVRLMTACLTRQVIAGDDGVMAACRVRQSSRACVSR